MQQIGITKIHAISEAMSPISHMMKTSGNEALLHREWVSANGRECLIPVISGNALRHACVREPGADYLIEQLGLTGECTIDVANYLDNGGSLTESSTNDNLRKIAELQELFPLSRLLGGCLRNQIISGSLIVHRGYVICEENKHRLNHFLPKAYRLTDSTLKSAECFVSMHQYTRGDAKNRKDLIKSKKADNEKDKTNLMIYSGQNLIAGTLFYHGFILRNTSPIEVGALIHSLNQWQASGGVIGGMKRIGHGCLKTDIIVENEKDFFGQDVNIGDCVNMYIDHVSKKKTEMKDWLFNTFPETKGKTKGKDNESEKLAD